MKEAAGFLLLVLALAGWPVFSAVFWLMGHTILGPISFVASILAAFVLYRGLTAD